MMQCESGETVLIRDSGGLTTVDRNARRRNIEERNHIFGSNMAATISNYKLATKKKYGAIQPVGTVPKI